MIGLRSGRGRRRTARSMRKAAEDRHIGFRWLPWEARLEGEAEAEAIFRAVVAELTPRLGADVSRHIASHLPLGLLEIWVQEDASSQEPQRVDRADVVAGVQSRLGLDRAADAEFLVTLVVAWLRHLAPEECDDVAAMLPSGLRDLWERAHLPQVPTWRQLVRAPSGYRRKRSNRRPATQAPPGA